MRDLAAVAFGARCARGAAAGVEALPGLRLGHAAAGDSGVTVLLAEGGAVGAVDVRGGGPGTRETDALDPAATVERVHAVVLAGGSAPGLAAADGVLAGLRERGVGVLVDGDHPGIRIPVVPAAVIFDLLLGAPDVPDAATGRAALAAALAADGGDAGSGCVGAGIGARAGALKGGLGRAAVRLPAALGGATVAAVVVANPLGAVAGADGRLFADPDAGVLDPATRAALTGRFLGLTKIPRGRAAAPAANTTIGAILTDAPVTPAQARRLAICGQDGLARAVRPAHLPMDGDTLFCLGDLGSGRAGPAPGVAVDLLAALAAAAADAVQAAIADAVLAAGPLADAPAFRGAGAT